MPYRAGFAPIAALLLGLCLSACETTGNSQRSQNKNYLIAGELNGVRQELAALRQDILGLHARLDSMGMSAGAPVAGDGASASVPPMGMPKVPGAPAENQPETPAAGAADEAVPYRILKEWGRTPEVAAQLDASSLKGMVCVVPPNAHPQALERLGRDLRAQFEPYDNITIDIFDQQEAAQQFLETPVLNPIHRVLHISRYRKDNQDMVVLFRDGLARPVGF